MPFLLPQEEVAAVKATFAAAREALAADWRSDKDVNRYLEKHADALDEAVRALAAAAGLPARGLSIAAVGGYGRRELFPFSDIDLLVLLEKPIEPSGETAERLSGFLSALWELGLSVGASVRTRDEFLAQAAKDVSIATTYLESRLLWGSETLFEAAREDFYAELDARAFFRDKMFELARRHQRYEDTPYSLEPNLKESPGGLRDIQVFFWCARAAGLGGNAEEMRHAELITAREAETIESCLNFLKTLRISLHLIAGRHEDRLLFDVQERLADDLGYRATAVMRSSEALMKRYYLHAKSVSQMSIIQLQAIADKLLGSNEKATPVRLESAFVARGDEMDLVDDDVFLRDPNALLRSFIVFATHPELTRMSTRLLRALWSASLSMSPAYRSDPANKATFLEILKLPHGTYHALKMMNTWSILGRFLIAFRHIVGQMQHDLYHIFTVDQHTLRVVRNIRRFARSEFAHEYPFCSQVMAEIPENWRVVVAGLFHDIGKGLGGRHEVIGAQKAEDFCRRFGFSKADTDFIVFLVREHLTMSRIAQKEDISDPNVVARFAKIVGSKERLDALYLLTVADIRATSPKVWTQWKAQLLETLYRLALDVLESGGETQPSAKHALQKRVEEAVALMADKVDETDRKRFWANLDVVYFMRHSAREIAWHAEELAANDASPEPIVRAKPSSDMGGLLLLIYLPDRKDLFLRAVAFFGRSGLSVVDARIHTTKSGWALDTFLVTDTYGRFGEREKLDKLERDLALALVSEKPLPPAPKAKLSRRSRHFPTRPVVLITPDESGRAHLLNIVGTDRLGLLFAISAVLGRYGVNLQTAKIATLGERAEDVFLIDGPALQNDETLLKLEAELLEALAAPIR